MSNMGINQKRKAILMKGFATLSDVRVFCKVGYNLAKVIMNEINEEYSCMPNKVYAKRLLDYIGLTEEDVFRYAELEEE